MFRSLLIANRGEIACRIIHTCRRLKVRTIAVFSEADRDAHHVELADEAVCIGPAQPSQSYLDAKAILTAAETTGAEALHPGYGFLSENAVFAEACAKTGFVFVGPTPNLIAQMGSKIEAKAVAESAGVPIVPGYFGNDQNENTLWTEANRIGAPLLIKASAGGGGRGMRRVNDLIDFETALNSARAEAETAFGDSTVLIERYMQNPRHIEVQLIGDHFGNIRHLLARDCSIQRNHQKIIEEAPAPNLSPSELELLTEYALRLAEAIKYDNVGTAEFIYDRDDAEFCFLEMNTRLQVEHPLTEMITGLDLVEWQLRIAAGEAITFTQEEVHTEGWAIEARITAEDPGDEYLPQIGKITAYIEPEIKGVRVDTGVKTGQPITPHYDSLIAKVIAHNHDRRSTAVLLAQALEEFRLTGVGTNLAFLHDIITAPDFLAGNVHTGFIDHIFPNGWKTASPSSTAAARAVLAFYLSQKPANQCSPWSTLGAWRLIDCASETGSAVLYLDYPDKTRHELQIIGRADVYTVVADEETHVLDVKAVADNVFIDDNVVTVFEGTVGHKFTALFPEKALLNGTKMPMAGDALITPMPGLIVDVSAKVGQTFKAGETLVIFEAMKLIQNFVAPRDCVISAVKCQPGQSVTGGRIIVEFLKEG